VESFMGRFRDECLNQLWFGSLAEAARVIEAWRQHDNRERPYRALDHPNRGSRAGSACRRQGASYDIRRLTFVL
jgi:putative transposase